MTKVELNGVKAGMKEEMAAQAKARGWSAEAMKFAVRAEFGLGPMEEMPWDGVAEMVGWDVVIEKEG